MCSIHGGKICAVICLRCPLVEILHWRKTVKTALWNQLKFSIKYRSKINNRLVFSVSLRCIARLKNMALLYLSLKSPGNPNKTLLEVICWLPDTSGSLSSLWYYLQFSGRSLIKAWKKNDYKVSLWSYFTHSQYWGHWMSDLCLNVEILYRATWIVILKYTWPYKLVRQWLLPIVVEMLFQPSLWGEM